MAIGVGAKLGYSMLDEWKRERELIVWDYVKKHPQDFPEVFSSECRSFASPACPLS